MRLSNHFFLKITLLSCFVFAGILTSYWMDIVSFEFIKSFVLAGFIAYLNFTLGFIAITVAFRKSTNTFLIAVLGGMVLRLFIMVIMVFISLKFLDIRAGVFIFVILFFYLVYMFIEFYYLLMEKGKN